MRIPGGPKLCKNERTPADDVAGDDRQRQFDSFRLCLRHAVHGRQIRIRYRGRTAPVSFRIVLEERCGRARPPAARRGLPADDDSCSRGRRKCHGGRRQRRKRRRRGCTAPDHRADTDVDGGEQQQRNDVDGSGKPGDVQRKRPVGLELLPAVIDARSSRRQLNKVEDDELRNGEDAGGGPSDGDETVSAGGRPRMTAHRMTDGDVAIQRGRHEHVRRRVENKNLRVLD